jgi:AcrR family transcriptional regulator
VLFMGAAQTTRPSRPPSPRSPSPRAPSGARSERQATGEGVPLGTVERLLEAAERSFAEHGFDGARLSDIAEAVGISRPSLLYHFASKDALYAAVVRTALLRLGEALSFAVDGRDDFPTRWVRAVEHFVEFVDARPALAKIILREVLSPDGPGRRLLAEAGNPVLDRMERFVRVEGRAHVAPDFPVREALMQLVSATLLKAAAGSLRAAFWGPEERGPELAARVLFGAAATPVSVILGAHHALPTALQEVSS